MSRTESVTEYVKAELERGNSIPLERVTHALHDQLTYARIMGNELEEEQKERALERGDIDSLLAHCEISVEEVKGIVPIRKRYPYGGPSSRKKKSVI